MRFVLTGGGSGGHIFPLIAVAQELRKRDQELELLYIGVRGQFTVEAKQSMEEEGIPSKFIFAGKLRRYFSLHYIIDFIKVPVGMVQAMWHLLWYMPDAVFSKGGYGAVPIVIAARIYHIPVLTHESDAMPGWANRVIGKLSQRIAISYPSARKYFLSSRVILTGNPIREQLLSGSAVRARSLWGFSESRPTILVVGGSQGAQLINETTIAALPELLEHAQVLHVTGKENYDEVVKKVGEQGIKSGHDHYVAERYLPQEKMADAYALADIVISRAGANSISEIAANRKVAIIIPLGNQDQRMNAYEIARLGGALVLEEGNLGATILSGKVKKLLADEKLRATMQEKISVFYHRDAAQQITAALIDLTQL